MQGLHLKILQKLQACPPSPNIRFQSIYEQTDYNMIRFLYYNIQFSRSIQIVVIDPFYAEDSVSDHVENKGHIQKKKNFRGQM